MKKITYKTSLEGKPVLIVKIGPKTKEYKNKQAVRVFKYFNRKDK